MADATAAPIAAPTAPVAPASDTQKGDAPVAPVPAPEVRRLKLQLRGREVEMPEHEVISRAQRSEDAARQYAEATKIQRAEEARRSRLREDPFGYLRESGATDAEIQQHAQKLLYEQYQREQMSPEQRQLEEERSRRADLEKRLADRESKDKQGVLAQHTERATRQYLADFEKALTSVGMKVDASNGSIPFAVSEMARLESINAENGFNLPPEELASTLRGNYAAGAQTLYGGLEGDGLLDTLERDMPGFWRKVSTAVVNRYSGVG